MKMLNAVCMSKLIIAQDLNGFFIFKKQNSNFEFVLGKEIRIVPICARKDKSISTLIYIPELAEFGSFLCTDYIDYILQNRRKIIILESRYYDFQGFKCVPTFISRTKHYFKSEDTVLEHMENFMRK
jgi:hypothetical protein